MSQEVPEGWYADPQDPTPGAERWWNGHSWTAHTRRQEMAPPPPPPTPTSPAGQPAYAPQATVVPQHLPDGTRLAELAPRIGAHVVDVLLVWAVASVLLLFVDVFTRLADELDLTATYFLLVATPFRAVVLGLLWVAYTLLFVCGSGATPGKRLFGLRVRRLETDQTLDRRTAALRALTGGAGMLFLMFPGAQLLALCLVGYDAYAMQKDRYRRPWHDQQAGSVVVTSLTR